MWTRLGENLQYAWTCLLSGRNLAIVLGLVLALVALGLSIASRTRWGQTKPLTKGVVLSILAHVWLLMYAFGSRIVLPQGDPHGSQHPIAVSLDATRMEPAGPLAALDAPETMLAAEDGATSQPPAWERPIDSDQLPVGSLLDVASAIDVPLAEASLLEDIQPSLLPDLPEPPLAAGAEPVDPKFVTATDPALAALASSTTKLTANVARPTRQAKRAVELAGLPEEYRLRQAADRLELARPFGADQDSEAAVSAALAWLAQAQGTDGGWNAKAHGAGTETFALGENRHGTGDRADTGISGLALLAFLASGDTHLDGEHRQTVQKGLEFLIHSQMPSGDLSGPKQIGNEPSVTTARMYCHGIATLALAEAFAMTHDETIREPLERAVRYTLAAQDPRGGGWRYRPGDPGDLSQFGWQAMALRSADRSGMRLEPLVKQRMAQFLSSCSTGEAGGLARYRPHEGAATPTMTAEALACRLLLQLPLNPTAQGEARELLLANLPGQSEHNVYYWYYATLALFQLQDDSWRRWNGAMKSHLLKTQQPAYAAEAGSWQPDPLWGGYGGRVYATAMSCLCLEVYYRYLPLYR